MVEINSTNPVVDAAPNKCPIVPSDWMTLGAESGYKPKVAGKLRLFVVGPSGEGKSTWLSSIERNLILDFDDGADAVPGSKAVRINIKNYAHLQQVRDKLLADAKAGKLYFTRVTIDTVDECIAMIKHKLENEKNTEDITDYRSEGYGYNLILQRFWGIILDIEEAGCSWAVVGHTKYKTEIDPATKKPVTRIRDSVYPGVSKKILTKSDFKVTIYSLSETIRVDLPPKIVQNGNQRIEVPQHEDKVVVNFYLNSLTTASEGTNKARGVPTMPKKFPLPLVGGWNVFKSYYDKAVNEARQRWGS